MDTSIPRLRGGALRRRVAAHPIAAFATMAFPLGLSFLALRVAGIASTTAGYAFTYIALLGSALVATWAGGGQPAVRHSLSRFLIWRLGVSRWALVVLTLPALTVAVAVASGPLHGPHHGWVFVAGTYLVQTFVTGALAVNLATGGLGISGGWQLLTALLLMAIGLAVLRRARRPAGSGADR